MPEHTSSIDDEIQKLAQPLPENEFVREFEIGRREAVVERLRQTHPWLFRQTVAEPSLRQWSDPAPPASYLVR